MPKKLSQEEFIERCKKKHNNYYSYDKTVYTGMSNDCLLYTSDAADEH